MIPIVMADEPDEDGRTHIAVELSGGWIVTVTQIVSMRASKGYARCASTGIRIAAAPPRRACLGAAA